MLAKVKELFHEEYPFRSNFIDVKGQRMHYIDEGTGDETVLMVHSGMCWSFFFRKIVRKLSDKRRVVVPDLIGYGLSEKSTSFGYTLEDHIDSLEELAEKLALNNITIVVHGWGATTGLGYAVRHSKKIKRVVALNGVAFIIPIVFGMWLLGRIYLLGLLLVRTSNRFMKHFFKKTGRQVTPAIKQVYLMPYDSYQSRIAIHRFIQNIPVSKWHPSWMSMIHIQRKLHTLKDVPFYIIWAKWDRFLGSGVFNKWRKYLPDAEFISFERSDFFMFEDEESELFKYVIDVIDNDKSKSDE